MNNKPNEMNHHPLVTMESTGRFAQLCFNPFGDGNADAFESFISTTPGPRWTEILENVCKFKVVWHPSDTGLRIHNARKKEAPMIALQLIQIAAPCFENLPAFKSAHPGWSRISEDEKLPDIAWVSPDGKFNKGVDYKEMMQEASRWLYEQGFLEVSQYEVSSHRSQFSIGDERDAKQ